MPVMVFVRGSSFSFSFHQRLHALFRYRVNGEFFCFFGKTRHDEGLTIIIAFNPIIFISYRNQSYKILNGLLMYIFSVLHLFTVLC